MHQMFSDHRDSAYAILRIVAGFLFMCHGLEKMFGVLGREEPVEYLSRLGVAGAIELVGGALLIVGAMTGIVAFICSGLMAAAFFMVHFLRRPAEDPSIWPIVNGGELAMLYCFLFLFIAMHGAGKWSIDGRSAS